MLAWFVGLIAFFAAEPEHPAPGIAAPVAAGAIGALAAFTCQTLQRRFAACPRTTRGWPRPTPLENGSRLLTCLW